MDAFESHAPPNSYPVTGIPIVLVDAENVRRSVWPNIARSDLVERCRAWAHDRGVETEVVFERERESADDRIRTLAAQLAGEGRPYWLVTSDRELRASAGAGAERIVGGGTFARELSRATVRRRA
jgi:predicted RNA-binding protein with PIN domain